MSCRSFWTAAKIANESNHKLLVKLVLASFVADSYS